MKVLIVAEPAMLTDPRDERLSRLLGAVAPLGSLSLLVTARPRPDEEHNTAALSGVTELIVPEASLSAPADWPPEHWAAWIASMAGAFSHIVADASPFGATVLPRVAALLDRAMVTGVQHIAAADTFVRAVLAGTALTTVQVSGQPVCLTLQLSHFAPAVIPPVPFVPRVRPKTEPLSNPLWSHLLARIPVGRVQRPELASARVVVAGGGGLVKGGSFALIEALADALGAAVGASRAAIDAGLVPGTWQIGQTGQRIAPDLYIGIGISGAIQHLAGIKDAKTIVAINQDPSAPLMCVADFALEADLYQAVPEWINATRQRATS